MARIYSSSGTLAAGDDYMHPLGPEPNFNESMYFNFFDPERALGGWFRIGNRANEGQAEMSVCLYLPDGRVLFMFQRPQIANNDAFDAGGLRFEVLEASQRLRTTYEGPVVELREPRAMSNPRQAFKDNPWKDVTFDLTHDAVGPMYGEARGGGEPELPADQQFASAHYEQHMHVTGTLTFDGHRIPVTGYGLRDHSWGPRYWQAIHCYEWLTMNFGADLGAMVTVIQRDAEGKQVKRGGVIVRGDAVEPIVEATVTAAYEAGTPYHQSVRAEVTTASGEHHTIDGRVRSFIPLRNRRSGMTTHIGEGMTEWTWGDRTGYGLSELLRQV